MANGPNEQYFPSQDFRQFLYEIQRGAVPGYTYEERNIFCTELSTTMFSTVWSFNPPSMYPYLTAATILKVSSSSLLDTAAGTGARTILIRGLDANYAIQSETVITNGQTPVNTALSYLRILDVSATTFGTDMRNRGSIYVGDGTVTAGVNDRTQGFINQSAIYSAMGVYTVPLGYTLIAFDSKYSVGAGKQATFRTVSRNPATAPWIQRAVTNLFAGPSSPAFEITTATESEKTDIEIQARGNVPNTTVVGNFQIALVDNSFV